MRTARRGDRVYLDAADVLPAVAKIVQILDNACEQDTFVKMATCAGSALGEADALLGCIDAALARAEGKEGGDGR